MLESLKEEKVFVPYYGDIGNFSDVIIPPSERKYTVIQSFWTKPIKDKNKLKDILYIAALSLTYAHRNGYKVNMHTDSHGAELLKDFGYDKLLKTLDKIPDSVPTELFAAGKFYALKAEGKTGKLHIDFDVFIKKPGLLDKFYEDKKIDVFAQQEENYNGICFYDSIIQSMHILGYPVTTRPDWNGSINTGVIGFNNLSLANKYINNYFDGLKLYTKDVFEKYKKENPKAELAFDFILEQVQLSFLSLNYRLYTLVPSNNPSVVADKIGYQHLQGDIKWKTESKVRIKVLLAQLDSDLYLTVHRAITKNIK